MVLLETLEEEMSNVSCKGNGNQKEQSAAATFEVWKVKRRMFLIKAVEAIERYGYWHGSTGSGISDASK